jgi:hypothetical protein
MRRYTLSLAAVSLLFALAACRGKEPAPASVADSSAQAAPAAPSPSVTPPSDAAATANPAPQVPALPAHSSEMPAAAGQAEPSHGAPAPAPEAAAAAQPVATIDFDLPAGWKSVPPVSNMRLAQATVDGPGGQAELAVFYFGQGQGGTAEANIQRWKDQMTGGVKPDRGAFLANGLKVTWIDLGGTMKPSAMGMAPANEQPNYRLLGAVVEGPGGPWFFKATGPDSTLGPQRDAFVKMLRTVRPKTGPQA